MHVECSEEEGAQFFFNRREAEQVAAIAAMLWQLEIPFSVITFYAAQRALIEEILGKPIGRTNAGYMPSTDTPIHEDKAFTVDSFQGRENAVIIHG